MTNVTDESTGSQSTTEQVKERVQGAAEQAKGQTREQLRTQIDTRSTQTGEQMSSTAQAFRRTSDQLRQEGNEGPAKIIDQVADRAERLGTYLTQSDGNRILRDVENFARRQPWLVAGGSAVLGFLASRFVKASSSRRYQESDGYAYAYGYERTPYDRTAYDMPSTGLPSRSAVDDVDAYYVAEDAPATSYRSAADVGDVDVLETPGERAPGSRTRSGGGPSGTDQ